MDYDDLEDSIVVDAEPRYSGPDAAQYTDLPTASPLSVDRGVQVESEHVQRPLRLLEEEAVHLQSTGLKLTDFEVRGTLGEFYTRLSY